MVLIFILKQLVQDVVSIELSGGVVFRHLWELSHGVDRFCSQTHYGKVRG